MLSALLLPLFAGVLLGLRWASYNLPYLPLLPVCREYDTREPMPASDRLHPIWGRLNEEFQRELYTNYAAWKEEYPEASARATDVRVADGRVYVALSYYFPRGERVYNFYLEPLARAYHASKRITYRIYQRRLAEGRFEGVDMSPYRVNRGAPMKYDECGFMEELILEGGRFAGPAESSASPAGAPSQQVQ